MESIKVSNFFVNQKQWLKNWSGNWSLLSCTNFGREYTVIIKQALGVGFDECIFITDKSKSASYFNRDGIKVFASTLSEKAKADPKLIDLWCKETKYWAKKVYDFTQKFSDDTLEITRGDFYNFFELMDGYASAHRAVKMVVDYLPADLLKSKFSKLQDARVYAEPVYAETEKFMEKWAKQLEKKTKMPFRLLLCQTHQEVDVFYKTTKLPSKSVLEKRYNGSVVYFSKDGFKVLTGKAVGVALVKLSKSFADESTVVKGACAFPGLAKGTVRVVIDPKKVKVFNNGDVLVTPILVKKANYSQIAALTKLWYGTHKIFQRY